MTRHVTRGLDIIVTATTMPIVFLVLFHSAFGGAFEAGAGRYADYLLPVVLLVAIAGGISYTGLRLPAVRSSALWSHVLTSLVANAVAAAVIVGVGVTIGFRVSADALMWIAVTGVLALLTLTLTWIVVIARLPAFTSHHYPAVFLPVAGVSGAFILTSIVAPVRALDVWLALGWCATIGVVAYVISVLGSRKESEIPVREASRRSVSSH